ncbi:MAG: hypothetical protein HQK78_20145 [Desulfobacterales bacterium]|nr:hypothetical protein [Desulfobacterales bacterium]
MDKKVRIQKKKLLVVEGKDECNFFDALFKHLQLYDIQTIDIGGKDKFNDKFESLHAMDEFSEITHIGFIRDAERNPAISAFNSICSILRKRQIPCPENPNQIIRERVSVGIFIMPDNQETGMLENLCLESIKNTPVYSCIDSFIDCLKQNQAEIEKEKFNESKSKVQSYLAMRSPIVNSLGLGAKNNYWNFNHACFADIKKFLSDLFF